MQHSVCRIPLTFLVVYVAAIVACAAARADRTAAQDTAARIRSTTDLVVLVSDAVLRDFPEPLPFNWGEGVLLAGMVRAYTFTRDERYRAFVEHWADHWQAQGIRALLAQSDYVPKQAYCGHWGPAFPLLSLFEITGKAGYRMLADEVLMFMSNHAERTRQGGLAHFAGAPQLWADTLYMACPVYARAARLEQRPDLLAEAQKQLLIFSEHLRDATTGLYYHMWDETTDTRTQELWARGNGWVAMSLVEVLRETPRTSEFFPQLSDLLARQLSALVACQDPQTGLWHTVLNAQDLYLETSASAMFLYALAEADRLALVPNPDRAAARRAWRGLLSRVDEDGRVFGVSGGTGPSDRDTYARIPTGTMTWGTGAFLLAACACGEAGLDR